jgi:hypothetical protein
MHSINSSLHTALTAGSQPDFEKTMAYLCAKPKPVVRSNKDCTDRQQAQVKAFRLMASMKAAEEKTKS